MLVIYNLSLNIYYYYTFCSFHSHFAHILFFIIIIIIVPVIIFPSNKERKRTIVYNMKSPCYNTSVGTLLTCFFSASLLLLLQHRKHKRKVVVVRGIKCLFSRPSPIALKPFLGFINKSLSKDRQGKVGIRRALFHHDLERFLLWIPWITLKSTPRTDRQRTLMTSFWWLLFRKWPKSFLESFFLTTPFYYYFIF